MPLATEEFGRKAKLVLYSLGEEIANAITHGVGALLAFAAMISCTALAAASGDELSLFAAVLYGLSLVVLFGMSTLYHAITHRKAKWVLRILDRCCIFLLIAGTYSPYTLITLRGPLGYALFAAIWGAAALGIVLNSVNLVRFEIVTVVLYIAMGWAVLLAIRPLFTALPRPGFYLLLGGGLLYMLGLVFFGRKWRYAHSIWHVFVLGGSTMHYLSIVLYVLA